MNWPYVSRDALDAILASNLKEKTEAHQRFCADLEGERNRYLDLLAKYHDLAKPAVAQTPEVPHLAREPKEKSPIALKIEEVAEGDPKVARWFWSQVSTWRRDGKSDGDILAEIRWDSTESTNGA